MKKIRIFFMMALFLLALSLGQLAAGTEAKAASLKNVLQAPKAKAGSWQLGNRYRYKATKEYAKNEWLNIDGYIYYFKSDGYPLTGLVTYNKKLYYFDREGALVIGWRTVKGGKYYFSKINGAAKLGKKKIKSKYYYFDPQTGRMQTGWNKIGKYYYYFYKASGIMAVSKTIGKYQVDSKGRLIGSNYEKPEEPEVPPVEKTGEVDIFVGDSRTAGMCSAVHEGDCGKCIAEISMGYNWLVSTAIPQLKTKLKANPSATVVFNLGINDIANYANYISKYKSLIKAYPKATFYFMSVNPIEGKKYDRYGYWGGSSNMKTWIKTFNKNLKNAFPNQYIDCYSYLSKKGFSTVDGLHYTAATYKKIYSYILTQV